MGLADMSSEVKFWLVLVVGLVAWFMYLYESVKPTIIANPMVSFFLVEAAFCFISMKWIMKINPLSEIKTFLSFLVILIAFDLITPPYLVNTNGPITSDPTVFTSDVVIWGLWSNVSGLAPDVLYILTFIVTPILLLFIAWHLVESSSSFYAGMKSAI